MTRVSLLIPLAAVCLFTACQTSPVGLKKESNAGAAPAPKHDFGFTAAFQDEIKKVGQISPDEFAQRFGGRAEYLPKLAWDPTTAQYWDRFTLDPNDPKAMTPIRKVTPEQAQHLFDFRLSEPELAVFKDKGFVVSERMGSHSFTDLYYRIYVRDLPVFVSSDSMLHVWHRYFDRMLEGMEAEFFQPMFKEMLTAMSEKIPAAQKAYGQGPLGEALTDVDFFLTVAARLLQPGAGQSRLGQEERVQKAVQACHSEQMLPDFPLFGRPRDIDFSQYKPRGRYAEHEHTKNYFRAVMWLGRIDFRIAGSDSAEQDIRELSGAVVLHDLLHRAGMEERWQQIDRALLQLIGKSDSLNVSQFGAVLADAGIGDASQVTKETLAGLRTRILDSKIGEQHIRGEWFRVNPTDPRPFVLPRTFAFMGQRFILDSWALSKIVYDDILWTAFDPKVGQDVTKKIQRRIPSCTDVAFAVFGNDHLVPALTQRMKNPAGREFRDGLPYQHNLTAVRNIIDRLPEETWSESLYADWLGCLRELSRPTTEAKYPEAMRSQAWALKASVTQLASWTQLRHDTVLYAKPSYTSGEACEYPAGFVEPVPHFWKRYEAMIERTKSGLAKLTFPDGQYKDMGKHLKERHLGELDRFLKAAGMLRAIAEKEVAHEELTAAQTKFLKEVVVRGGGSGMPPVSGWYPNLFSQAHRSKFKDQDDAHKWVALVTDVHTDPPAVTVPDPGCVIHQGVGNVDALVIAVDNGKDRMVYVGPVFSHYEFEAPNAVRRTNGEWHDLLRAGTPPPRPEWTRGFVVPGVNPESKNYGKASKRMGE
jgi:hypothetical protein